MTPSREELQYTEETKRNLKKHLAAAVNEVAVRVREDVMTPMATRWQWFRKIQAYYDTLPYGIQQALGEFLKAAGVSDAEARTVVGIVKEKYAEVPKWVGDGLTGPHLRYLRDADGRTVRDGQDEPVVEPGQDLRGARVWLYTWDSAKKSVRRKEVIHGMVRQGSEPSPVHLSFLQDIRLFYADAKAADARIRGLVQESETTMLLVVACKGTPASYAQEYAQRIAGKTGLDGLPVAGASTLGVPGFVSEGKERRKRQRELSPREFFADQEVKFMDMSGRITDITLSELEEDTDHYYLCMSKAERASRATYRNDVKDNTYSFSGYWREETLRAMNTLLRFFGKPIAGVVLVTGEGAARRMKFAAQGIKPFLPWLLDEVLGDKDRVQAMRSVVSRYPTVDLSQMNSADDYGWVGILAHHATRCTRFWKQFLEAFPQSPVTATVLDFMAKCGATEEATKNSGLVNAWAHLSSKVTNHNLDKVTAGRYGKTGGYLLVAPQHQLFVTASDKTRVMQPLPAQGINTMHDRYMLGFEGFGIAFNFFF